MGIRAYIAEQDPWLVLGVTVIGIPVLACLSLVWGIVQQARIDRSGGDYDYWIGGSRGAAVSLVVGLGLLFLGMFIAEHWTMAFQGCSFLEASRGIGNMEWWAMWPVLSGLCWLIMIAGLLVGLSKADEGLPIGTKGVLGYTLAFCAASGAIAGLFVALLT